MFHDQGYRSFQFGKLKHNSLVLVTAYLFYVCRGIHVENLKTSLLESIIIFFMIDMKLGLKRHSFKKSIAK